MVDAITRSFRPILPPDRATVNDASAALKLLVEDKALVAGLVPITTSKKPPTREQALSALWDKLTPKGDRLLTKDLVRDAITALKGTAEQADALWRQMDSAGYGVFDKKDFLEAAYLTESIDRRLPDLAKAVEAARNPDLIAEEETKNADAALALFLADESFLAAQAQVSLKLFPTTRGKILSNLWTVVNFNGAQIVTKDMIETAVIKQGGSSTMADALWKKLDVEKSGGIRVGDFAASEYMVDYINTHLPKIIEAVEDARLKSELAPVGSNNVIGNFFPEGGSGTILDLFA